MLMPAAIPVLAGGSRSSASALAGQWWKSFFDSSEDALVVCRRDGAVEQINPRALRFFKIKPAALVDGVCIFNLLSPPADRKLREILQREESRPDTLHSIVAMVAGAPRGLADLEITPLAEGCTLLTFKDGSHRLRLESHVQRLVTAIDATPDVFFIGDADAHITFVNPAFQSTTGYGIEDVLGRTDEFLRAPFEHNKVRAYLDCVRQGREWIGELVNLRQDGTIYHVETTISPISDMAGRYMGYVVCERDVTSRKNLKTDLRVERDFVRSILHSLDGAIYALDEQFRLNHANEGWRSLPAEHAGIRLDGPPRIGRCLLDHVPDPARRAELRFVFQSVVTNGNAEENHFASPDGRYWLVRTSPWIHADRVRGLICSVTDQTHYQELQNQLFQSQKMEIIGTLAAGVAHDFNNLLQAIRGNNGLVLLGIPEDSHLRRFVNQINVATTRAAEITKQLLSFSRESEEKRTVLDLNQVIAEAGQLVRRTLRGNVSLEIVPAKNPIHVKVDSTRANQALLNLCVNAQDAMPNGGRLNVSNNLVHLTLEQAGQHGRNEGDEFARCSVTDTGMGIPADLLLRIFEPFFTTKEKGKGTGLGLPIIQRVMHEAGGFVEVESVLSRGTAFHLYFSIATGDITHQCEQSHQPLTRCSGRVLVVDDLDLVRDFTRSFLEAAGLTVQVACDGHEALKILEKNSEPVDLLFTDYNMRGMNGVELIETVAVRWPAIRLLLASSYLDETVRQRLSELNASVLGKPYEMRQASDVIIKLLPKR